MSPARWQEVKKLFEAAQTLPRAERDAFLNEACADEPELRAEVESLLMADQEAEDFLEASVLQTGSHAHVVYHAIPDQTLGQRLGPYRIERELGQGGMGTVYEAVRADDLFRKRVAIKVVKRGMDNGAMLKRFRHERQILAALEHPGIARLLDAGLTPDGLPYLVMEYVSGQVITTYCDERRLTTMERIRLFQQVCEAVQAAHDQGVIHRDIKPGNILVTTNGAPKLLDFGIAKVLNPELQTGSNDPTATLLRMMTPEYASPEQVRGDLVTPASDVYTLGVLLYELLTGHRPYRRKTRAPHELAKLICEQDPPKPSTVVGDALQTVTPEGTRTITAEEVSRVRGSAPADLRRKLSGDLDDIVLKAMRKEPERRYASARALSEDLQRHLDGLPVSARRDTLSYRGLKFVRRHRFLATSVAVYVVLFAVALGYWFAKSPSAARLMLPSEVKSRPSIAVLGFQNLTRQADTAWLATALAEMLTTELASNEDLRAVPQENVARVKTELAVAEGESLAKDSLQKVYQNLSANYIVLGSYLASGDAGRRTFRWDLRVQDALTGQIEAVLSDKGTESDLPTTVARVGAVLRQKFGTLVRSTRPSDTAETSAWSNPEALQLYAEGLAEARRLNDLRARDLLQRAAALDPAFPWPHMTLAVTWQDLGYERLAEEEAKKAYDLSGKLPRQERLYIEGRYHEIRHDWAKATESFRTLRIFYPDDLNYGLRLASVQTLSGHGVEAVATLDELRRLPKPQSDDPRLDLAEANAAAALSDYRRQLAASQRAEQKGEALGTRNLVARALTLQGAALDELGEWENARKAYQRAYDLSLQVSNRAIEASALHGLALVRHEQGHPAEAIQLAEKELAVSRELGNKKSIANALSGLGRLHQAQGEPVRAQQVLAEANALWRELDDRRDLALGLTSLGQLLLTQGDLKQAKPLYEESLALSRALGDKGSVAKTQYSIARVALRQGELGRALDLARESLALRREVGDESNIPVVEQFTGGVLWQQGDLVGARAVLQRVVTLKRQQGDRRILAYTLYNLGSVLLQSGDVTAARQSWEEARTICKTLNEKGVVAGIQLGLAEVAMEQGNPNLAETLALESAAEFSRENRPDDESLALTVRARALVKQGQLAEAQKAVRRAGELLQPSQIFEPKLLCQLATARVAMASGNVQQAEVLLADVLAKAANTGFVFDELEARLALGELEMRTGRASVGEARLAKLQQEAEAKGYRLVAQHARAARRKP